jgi:hypothetical protein
VQPLAAHHTLTSITVLAAIRWRGVATPLLLQLLLALKKEKLVLGDIIALLTLRHPLNRLRQPRPADRLH